MITKTQYLGSRDQAKIKGENLKFQSFYNQSLFIDPVSNNVPRLLNNQQGKSSSSIYIPTYRQLPNKRTSTIHQSAVSLEGNQNGNMIATEFKSFNQNFGKQLSFELPQRAQKRFFEQKQSFSNQINQFSKKIPQEIIGIQSNLEDKLSISKFKNFKTSSIPNLFHKFSPQQQANGSIKQNSSSQNDSIFKQKENDSFLIKGIEQWASDLQNMKKDFNFFDDQNIFKSENVQQAQENQPEEIQANQSQGQMPPQKDPEEEEERKKQIEQNMKVSEESTHIISENAKLEKEKFKNLYQDIKMNLEALYGKGNGDYEVKNDLYELVPKRLPVNEDTSQLIKQLVDQLVNVIDFIYKDKPYQRFYVLETIARVPYFSYISCLHLLETIGYHDKIGWLRIHWAEGWNELHHLLIMEELGGSKDPIDRFLAQTTAVFYYWVVVVLYFLAPDLSYNLSEQIEKHAYETYDQFLKENEKELKLLPAPKLAVEYYKDNTYMFDDFQSCRVPGSRRPIIRNLYDVFFNIRNDEAEHFLTMIQAQDTLSIQKNPSAVLYLTDEQKKAYLNSKSISLQVQNPVDQIKEKTE